MDLGLFAFLLLRAVSADRDVVHCDLEEGGGLWDHGASVFCVAAGDVAACHGVVFFVVKKKKYLADTAVALCDGLPRVVGSLGGGRRVAV